MENDKFFNLLKAKKQFIIYELIKIEVPTDLELEKLDTLDIQRIRDIMRYISYKKLLRHYDLIISSYLNFKD